MLNAWQPRSAESDVYIPHPAPNAPGNEDDQPKMGFLSMLKSLIIPALIALILYLFISYLVVPIWKRYRGRYSQYLPLDTISTHTSSIRERVQDAIVRWLMPSSWRRDFAGGPYTVSAQDGASDFDEDEGEELYEVDDNRREAISLDQRRGRDDSGRRLSRDLEEGFKDDSDDDEEEGDVQDGSQGRTLTR